MKKIVLKEGKVGNINQKRAGGGVRGNQPSKYGKGKNPNLGRSYTPAYTVPTSERILLVKDSAKVNQRLSNSSN